MKLLPADLAEFLHEIILILTATEKTELRSSVYRMLKDMKSMSSGSRSDGNFTKTFDTVICRLLSQLSQPQQEQDRVFICQLIAIMTDAENEGTLLHRIIHNSKSKKMKISLERIFDSLPA